jgi:branched-subunit amino acid aminotransferase/4-amino-4-deoxychorismate lyase
MTVLINGVAHADDAAAISVLDPIVLRGDGCFEATRIYGGSGFRLNDHLDRLARSARALGIALPPVHEIVGWCETLAAEREDGVLRVLASTGPAGEGTLIVMTHPLGEMPLSYRLEPVVVPWHAAGDDWVLAGVKTLSYAPNMAAGRIAVGDGFDDALLVSRDGAVLELPTSSVMWAINGTLETPSLDLGILESITRRVALELCADLGIGVVEGRFALDRLHDADEVMVLSSTKEVRSVVAVGERSYGRGPITASLSTAYSRQVISELMG